MAFNLDYTITFGDDAAAAARLPGGQIPARAAVWGDDIEQAKRSAEDVLASVRASKGELFETPGTEVSFQTGTLVSTFAAGEGWTDQS